MKPHVEQEKYTEALIKQIAKDNDVDISSYRMDQLVKGMKVELEHGTELGDDTNVTGNDPMATLQIVIAHMKELSDYYDRLEKMENESLSIENIHESLLLSKVHADVSHQLFLENVTPSNVNGMGDVILPGDPTSQDNFDSQTLGSGDSPAGATGATVSVQVPSNIIIE